MQRTVKFFTAYKQPPRIDGLTWTHYRAMLPLGNQDERTFYVTLVQQDGLTSKQLTAAISNDRYHQDRDNNKKGAKPRSTRRFKKVAI